MNPLICRDAQIVAVDALITLTDGQTITLKGVHAADLTAANFVFDLTPNTDNPGTISIGNGAMLPLSGDIIIAQYRRPAQGVIDRGIAAAQRHARGDDARARRLRVRVRAAGRAS